MKRLEESVTIRPVDKQLLLDLKQRALALVPDAAILLYGSVATGVAGPESDYDILVLLNAPLSREEEDRIRDVIYDLQVERGVVMSVIFYTREEWDSPISSVSPYRRNIEREGVLL